MALGVNLPLIMIHQGSFRIPCHTMSYDSMYIIFVGQHPFQRQDILVFSLPVSCSQIKFFFRLRLNVHPCPTPFLYGKKLVAVFLDSLMQEVAFLYIDLKTTSALMLAPILANFTQCGQTLSNAFLKSL